MAVIKRFDFHGSFYSMRPFIIEVNSGASGDFTIPTDSSYVYNYDVSSSDGQMFTGVTGDLTITFPSTNTNYFIEIRGVFPAIYFNNSGDKDKILYVVQWGDIVWKNMIYSFYGCLNLDFAQATDTPNLSECNDMGAMFNGGNVTTVPMSITGSFNNWDVSKIKSLSTFLWNSGYAQDIDFSDPIKGSINLENIHGAFGENYVNPPSRQQYKGKSIKLQAGKLNAFIGYSAGVVPFNTPYIEEFILIEMKNNFFIHLIPNVLGTAIDDLANSVADLTGQTQSTVTMTTAQYNSGIDTTIWTNKNWAIAQV